MDEAEPADEEFDVQLEWPRGEGPGAKITRARAGDASGRARLHRSDEQVDDVVRRRLDEDLGRRADDFGRTTSLLNQLGSTINDVSAVVHRLATSTAALADEVASLVEVTRRNADQTSSLRAAVESTAQKLDEGLSELRADLARVADEVSTVRRRLPVQARDATAHR